MIRWLTLTLTLTRACLHPRYCIHPNYFGDLFTYGGWGLASGTQCAMSLSPVSLFYLTLKP